MRLERRDVARVLAAGFSAWLAAALLLVASPARAQAVPPAPHADSAFDFMNLLTQRGWHNLDHEAWNAYGQTTYISSWHPGFPAAYTNADGSVNSLVADPERSYTFTATLFLGIRLWPGGEGYFVPEFVAETPFSNLRGLGGSIQNFELQKNGSPTGQIYRSRTFLRQRIELGGKPVDKDSQPLQLGLTGVDSRRLVLTAGTFTALDIFDRNAVTGDPRQTFLNMAFQTHASWDFGADARGYSDGGAAELYWDDWAFRVGRLGAPQEPNSLAIDYRLWQYYSDTVEVEHDHELFGRPGAVRLLGYRNQVYSGNFADAIAAFQGNPAHNAAACTGYNFGSGNAMAPDVCWVRKENVKVGAGVNVEQFLTDDIGVFFRAMYSDGQSEVDAYNPADRDLSFGSVARGSLWHRPFDVTGLGFGMSWISAIHAQYLAMGGIDNFIGDGHLHQAAEGVLDAFYSFNLLRALWLTADYEFVWNPGFNSDRGPVHIFGGRAHAEF